MAPCWLPKSTKNASWGSLGGSWALLEASWSVLGSSWSVLERLGRVLGRLGAENESSWARQVTDPLRIAAPLGPGYPPTSNEEGNLRKENLQRDYRPLQTELQRTPTRSWAPSGPVRIQQRSKAATPPPRQEQSNNVASP